MENVMFGSFNGYEDWQTQVMDVCQQFYDKYNCFPNFIRMKLQTLNALFAEEEKQPFQISKHDRAMIRQYLEEVFDYGDEEEFGIYPVEFGPNDDGTVSFATNKYELYFLEGDDLRQDYFIVQFGDGPSDDGEEFEEDESEESANRNEFVA